MPVVITITIPFYSTRFVITDWLIVMLQRGRIRVVLDKRIIPLAVRSRRIRRPLRGGNFLEGYSDVRVLLRGKKVRRTWDGRTFRSDVEEENEARERQTHDESGETVRKNDACRYRNVFRSNCV